MTAYNHPPPLTQTYDRLKDRVVLVTGASSGIGEAATKLFAAEGAKVVAAARSLDKTEALAAGLRARGLQVDTGFAVETFGGLDGAFNNAGAGGGHAPIGEADVEWFDRIMAVNLRGVFLCLKHETRAMSAQGRGGAIVNTSSIGGLVGGAGNSIYAASKWGLAGLTKCAALDYARQNIRINAIAPGPTRSDMFDRWMTDEAQREWMASNTPMNYIAHPEDMARAALYLLTDEARWTTGAILPCEGGLAAD